MYIYTYIYIYILILILIYPFYLGQPVAGLKRGLWGGGGARKVLENEKVVLEKKMWEKCGVQNQKIGVWAWCLIIPFVVLKTA